MDHIPMDAFTRVLDMLEVVLRLTRPLWRTFEYMEIYGISGIFLHALGNSSTWKAEARVLGKLDDEEAMAFRNSSQGQFQMISVAAAIVAQIAITAITLDSLGQSHWVAKGALTFSLVAALMAVYHSTAQYLALGRLLKPEQIRAWIRGTVLTREDVRGLVPRAPLQKIVTKLGAIGKRLEVEHTSDSSDPQWVQSIHRRKSVLRFFIPLTMPCQACEPEDFEYQLSDDDPEFFPTKLRSTCFTPSFAAVVTLSAPQALLSASLVSLLVGLGVYFGFVWTRHLGLSAGDNDDRNVFITYVVGIAVCIIVYTIAEVKQQDDMRSEKEVLGRYMLDWLRAHQDVVNDQWNLEMSADVSKGPTFVHRVTPVRAANH